MIPAWAQLCSVPCDQVPSMVITCDPFPLNTAWIASPPPPHRSSRLCFSLLDHSTPAIEVRMERKNPPTSLGSGSTSLYPMERGRQGSDRNPIDFLSTFLVGRGGKRDQSGLRKRKVSSPFRLSLISGGYDGRSRRNPSCFADGTGARSSTDVDASASNGYREGVRPPR